MIKRSKKEKPLLSKKYLLEKYPGKGGWTYAAIPEVIQDKDAPFGCLNIRFFLRRGNSLSIVN
jgi:hypothetical protein